MVNKVRDNKVNERFTFCQNYSMLELAKIKKWFN